MIASNRITSNPPDSDYVAIVPLLTDQGSLPKSLLPSTPPSQKIAGLSAPHRAASIIRSVATLVLIVPLSPLIPLPRVPASSLSHSTCRLNQASLHRLHILAPPQYAHAMLSGPSSTALNLNPSPLLTIRESASPSIIYSNLIIVIKNNLPSYRYSPQASRSLYTIRSPSIPLTSNMAPGPNPWDVGNHLADSLGPSIP
eukprot:gene6138-2745_t